MEENTRSDKKAELGFEDFMEMMNSYIFGIPELRGGVRKKEEEPEKPGIPVVEKIITQGIATIVFWGDGTKTVVKRAEDEPDSVYAAFTAALAIKCYGSNSAVKRIVGCAKEKKTKKERADEDKSVVEDIVNALYEKLFTARIGSHAEN